MRRLRIYHLTTYQFSGPVTLQPHRLLIRPREGHDVRIESSKLNITPAHRVRWHRDVFDNSVAVVRFLEPADRLAISSEVTIQHYDEAPFDFIVEDYAVRYPFSYRPEEQIDLVPFQQPAYPGPHAVPQDWLGRFTQEPLETYVLLDRLNRTIASEFQYLIRE
ncbi:MAG: transglutaminase N-terminal domain-containing protein, partial [Candidatus Competibacteraceae bacterium]